MTGSYSVAVVVYHCGDTGAYSCLGSQVCVVFLGSQVHVVILGSQVHTVVLGS